MDATTVEATYKTREVEGFADVYFYRKIGFRLAQFFAERNIRPATVTFIGGAFGILLDSVVDHVVWFGVYLHLTLRHLVGGGSGWIWLLALAAGMSHAIQSLVADYCRIAYLYFSKGKSKANFDSAVSLQKDYRELPGRGRFLDKILLAVYTRATRQQEKLLPKLAQLHERVKRDFPQEIPAGLQSRYRTAAQPVMKWCGWLMTNTRMFLLFLFLLIANPTWFFWTELTLFNCLLAYVIFQQRKISKSMLELIERPSPA